jgi:hypothetical protein
MRRSLLLARRKIACAAFVGRVHPDLSRKEIPT